MSITPLLNHCFYKCQVPLAIESAPERSKTVRVTNLCENTEEMPKWQRGALIRTAHRSWLRPVSNRIKKPEMMHGDGRGNWARQPGPDS